MIAGRAKGYYTYILASRNNEVLTVGMTADLFQLAHQLSPADQTRPAQPLQFRLVYYEFCIEPTRALNREQRINGWKREWQVWLIEDQNPQWCDLGFQLLSHSNWSVASKSSTPDLDLS